MINFRNLGEFLNLSLDGDIDPVQQRLGNLKLNGESFTPLNFINLNGGNDNYYRKKQRNTHSSDTEQGRSCDDQQLSDQKLKNIL